MAKTKYKYNPKTLSYDEVQKGWGERILKGILVVSPSIVIGIVLAFVLSNRIDSPKEKQLKQDLAEQKVLIESMLEELDLTHSALDDIEQRDEELYRVSLYAEEFPEELRRMGTGGSAKYAQYENMTNSDIIIETMKKLDQAEKRIHAQSLSFKELLQIASEKEARLSSMPAIQPVNNKDLKHMASGYGWRIDPIYKTKKMHWGMDFTAPTGTDIYSTGNGKVVEARRNGSGYGNVVVIDHGFGYRTRYAHMSKFNVKEGDIVKRGDLIGFVGSTGKSTGPHLHYEVEKNGKKVNPIGFYHSDLSPEQYEKLLEMSKNAFKSFD